jgi:adenylosuccinate lyase
VQRNALAQVEHQGDGAATPGPSFCERLLGDTELRARLSEEALRACFDLSYHLRHVPAIIDRALASSD